MMMFMLRFILIFMLPVLSAMPTIIQQSHQPEMAAIASTIRGDLEISKANYHAGRLQLLLKQSKDWQFLQCRIRSERNEILLEKTFKFKPENRVWAAHQCSDMTLLGLMGKEMNFSGRIAWVTANGDEYLVNQTDYTFKTNRTLFKSREPILSLAWTPDATSLYYIKKNKGLYYINRYNRLANSHTRLYQSKTPMSDLVWDQSQSQLIFTKAVHGIQKMFVLQDKKAQQLSFGRSIDVSPTISKGKIVFVSDAADKTQLFKFQPGGVRSKLPLEGQKMAMPIMYHHQLYWVEASNQSVMVYDSYKKEVSDFVDIGHINALALSPFGLLIATDKSLSLYDFDGGAKRRFETQGLVMATSWMDV